MPCTLAVHRAAIEADYVRLRTLDADREPRDLAVRDVTTVSLIGDETRVPASATVHGEASHVEGRPKVVDPDDALNDHVAPGPARPADELLPAPARWGSRRTCRRPLSIWSPKPVASIAAWMDAKQPPVPPGFTQRTAASTGTTKKRSPERRDHQGQWRLPHDGGLRGARRARQRKNARRDAAAGRRQPAGIYAVVGRRCRRPPDAAPPRNSTRQRGGRRGRGTFRVHVCGWS